MNDIPYIPTAEELEEVGGTVQNLSPYELDPGQIFEPIQYTLSLNGIGYAPRGDIQYIKAPQKSGKTFLITLIMGAILNGEYLGVKSEVENPRILYIDTEQHPRNTQLVYRRACLIAGLNGREYHDNFKVFHMRGAQPSEIQHALLQCIVFWKPTSVFLDGYVDIINDPNDFVENKMVITKMLAIALKHNCSIWNVLHVNPGSDKMRGFSGTIGGQKGSDVLQCLKVKLPDGSVAFEVTQTDTRNKDINKLTFCIEDRPDGNGGFIALPVATYINVKEKTEIDDIMQRALADGPLRSSDLIQKIVDNGDAKQSKAYQMKNKAVSEGIIQQDTVTYRYRYVGLDLTEKKDCPF